MSAYRRVAALVVLSCLAAGCSARADTRADDAVQALALTRTSASSHATANRLCTNAPAPAPLPSPADIPASSRMGVIKKRGRLIVGVDQNTMLFAYLNPASGSRQGFEIDLAYQIAKAIFGDEGSRRVDFVSLLTSERLSAVQAGRVDLVIDAMTMTCDRARKVGFSTIYFMAHQRTLVRSDSQAVDLHGLAGMRVCATNTSTALAVLQDARYHVIPYPRAARTDCLVALQRGIVAGVQADDAILYGLHEQDPYTKILFNPRSGYSDEPYGIAIDKRYPELISFVDSVLNEMRHPGAGSTLRSWVSLYDEWIRPVTKVAAQPPRPVVCEETTRCTS